MARKRMINPNIWTSQDVGKLTIFERLLLIGMFSNADDEGKGIANSALLRSIIFPYDNIPTEDMDKAKGHIEKHINIQFYVVDGNEYYKFTNWKKWQTVNRPQVSIIPEPFTDDSMNNHGTISEQSVINHGAISAKRREDNRREINIEEDNKGNEIQTVNENEIQTASSLDTVVNHYCEKANIISLNFKPKDLQIAEELLKTIPVDIIKKGIDLSFKTYKPDYQGAKINSFGYCKPIILKLWKDINSKEALQSGGTEQNKSPTGDKDRDGIGITI